MPNDDTLEYRLPSTTWKSCSPSRRRPWDPASRYHRDRRSGCYTTSRTEARHLRLVISLHEQAIDESYTQRERPCSATAISDRGPSSRSMTCSEGRRTLITHPDPAVIIIGLVAFLILTCISAALSDCHDPGVFAWVAL
jgi:hypothetical protein